MSKSDLVELTVKNANVGAIIDALNNGVETEKHVTELIACVFAQHEAFDKDFLEQSGFEWSPLFVYEAILENHAQSVNDDRPGLFAARLLQLAQEGLLTLQYTPDDPRFRVMFGRR